MIDLAKIFSLRKTEAAPALSAILVAKSEDLDSIKAALLSVGLDAGEAFDKDGVTVIPMGDQTSLDNTVVFKSGDVAYAITNVKKGFSSYNYTSTNFKELLATEGFYPSLSAAMDALRYGIYNALDNASDASASVGAIQSLFDDAKNYVTSLVGTIPVTAFKLDDALVAVKADKSKAKAKAKPEDGEVTDETKKPAEIEPKTDEQASEVKATADKSASVETAKSEDKGDASTTGTATDPAPAAADDVSVTKSEELGATLERFMKSMDEKFGVLSKSVETALTTAQKAEELASGVISGEAPADRVQKSDPPERSSALVCDTGYAKAGFINGAIN